MNTKHTPQRIVLGVGLLLVILNGLFPPYEGGWQRNKLTKYLGHYFLFAPPSPAKVYRAFNGKDTMSRLYGQNLEKVPADWGTWSEVPVDLDTLNQYSAHVVTSLFFIQLVTITA